MAKARICRIRYSYTDANGAPKDREAILINQNPDISPDVAKRELLKTKASLRNVRDLTVTVIPGGVTQQELINIQQRIPAGTLPTSIGDD